MRKNPNSINAYWFSLCRKSFYPALIFQFPDRYPANDEGQASNVNLWRFHQPGKWEPYIIASIVKHYCNVVLPVNWKPLWIKPRRFLNPKEFVFSEGIFILPMKGYRAGTCLNFHFVRKTLAETEAIIL
jgi:hypothetical protein